MRFSRRSKRGSCRANNRLPWTKPRAAKRAQPIRGRSARGAVILEASQTHKRFHVGIVGGGIGGLALAQGLKKAGVSVALYERDATPTDRLQGYRVRISPKGSAAAHDCLPADLFDLFAATCSVDRRRFRFLTEKMEELLSLEFSGEPGTIAQNRAASRRLDGIVQFGKAFTRYEETAVSISPTAAPRPATCWSAPTAAIPASANSSCHKRSASTPASSASRRRPC
jgi:hypothetical protein